MISLPSVDVEFALLCEGVRREDNGKLFAYGIFGNSVLLREFPVVLGLCLLLRVKAKSAGEFDLNVRVMLEGEVVVEMNGKMQSAGTSPETTPTPVLPVQIAKPGILEFALGEGDVWVPAVTVTVEKAEGA